MPQVGSIGQRKLLDSKVLMVGAGGLGSPILIYLTLAGVGTLGIVDFDVVDVTNLQRQILHYDKDIGKPKVESAKETLKAYNPEVNIYMILSLFVASDNILFGIIIPFASTKPFETETV